MGPTAAQELLGSDGIDALNRAESAGRLLQKKATPHPWIVGSTQVGSMFQAIRGLYNGMTGNDFVNFTVAGTMVLGPKTLARIITKPQMYATLQELGQTPPGVPRYGAIAVRLIRQLANDDQEAENAQHDAAQSTLKLRQRREWEQQNPIDVQARKAVELIGR
jgi:hypothetical protein